jgi:hypothetical protein
MLFVIVVSYTLRLIVGRIAPNEAEAKRLNAQDDGGTREFVQ